MRDRKIEQNKNEHFKTHAHTSQNTHATHFATHLLKHTRNTFKLTELSSEILHLKI